MVHLYFLVDRIKDSQKMPQCVPKFTLYIAHAAMGDFGTLGGSRPTM